MRMRWALATLALLSITGAATSSADPGGPGADTLTFTGTVTGDTPAPLPADSVLTVTLEDVSLADAPAVTLAQSEIPAGGLQTPIPFTMSYPASEPTPRAVYAARARVSVGERLLYTTTQQYRVDALSPAPAELSLQPVQPSVPATPDAPLTDTYWKVVAVDGQPVAVAETMREPSLVLHASDGHFAGSGGVNRLMGGFAVDGPAITFTPAASTMMAGPPQAMAQEQAIIAALGRARGWSVSGGTLTLTDQGGAAALEAEAVALR